MRLAYSNLKPVVAAFALVAAISAVSTGAAAQSAGPAEEAALLRQLAEAGPAEARRVERQLQAIWTRSGSDAMDLLLTRGREALERGDAKAAVEHLTALTDHAPGFAEGWHLRASAWFELGRYGLAIDDLGRALTLNPNNYAAIFGLASILEALGDEDRAYAAYERVTDLNPNFEDATEALRRLAPRVKGKTL